MTSKLRYVDDTFADEHIDFAFPTQVAIPADQDGKPVPAIDRDGPAGRRTAATGASSAGEVAPE